MFGLVSVPAISNNRLPFPASENVAVKQLTAGSSLLKHEVTPFHKLALFYVKPTITVPPWPNSCTGTSYPSIYFECLNPVPALNNVMKQHMCILQSGTCDPLQALLTQVC